MAQTRYEYELRPMKLEDLEEVYSIEVDSFTLPWSRDALTEEIASVPGAHMLVAEYEGKVVGYAGFRQVVDEAQVTNIAVAHDWRGRGVGHALMDQMMADCPRLGIGSISLEVRVSNKGAIHLYERKGFSARGIRRGFYERPKEDAVIMVKDF